MLSMVQAHLRSRAELLLAGQLSQVARDYHYPLLVQLDDKRVIVRTPNEALAILALFRQGLLARRIVALQPTVAAIDLPRGGRFRLWVDWQEFAASGEETRVSSAIYYCRQAPGGLQIEMIQYTRLSMPELTPQFAAIALSA